MVVLPVDSVGMLGGLGAFAILGALAMDVEGGSCVALDLSLPRPCSPSCVPAGRHTIHVPLARRLPNM